MPGKDGRPGEGSRGDASDHRLADEITTDGIPSPVIRLVDPLLPKCAQASSGAT
jgi:hypothetical protein